MILTNNFVACRTIYFATMKNTNLKKKKGLGTNADYLNAMWNSLRSRGLVLLKLCNVDYLIFLFFIIADLLREGMLEKLQNIMKYAVGS